MKDLNSKWEPSDRSGKWLKLKPEYIRAGSDLDVLIIGLKLISHFSKEVNLHCSVLYLSHFMQGVTMVLDVMEVR